MNKKIVITGVSSGIGYAIAKVLCKSGYTVYGSVRTKKDASIIKQKLRDNFYPLVFDVTNSAAISQAAKEVQKNLSDGECLAGLVNNAGAVWGGPVAEIPTQDFRDQFEVNFFGVIETTKKFLPLLGADKKYQTLKKIKKGKIINISSISADFSFPFMSPYSSSKFALEGFSQALRIELLLYGIDVVVVAPGPVQSEIWNKNSGEKEKKRFDGTDYETSAKLVYNFIQESAKQAIPADKVGNLVKKLLEKNKSKFRYVVTKQTAQQYILPKILPKKIINKFIQKRLKLKSN